MKNISFASEARKILFCLLTYKCNLGCAHCVAPKTSDEMGARLFEKIISIYKNEICAVALSGGEPCLSPHFYEICKIIIANNLALSINTNGEVFAIKYRGIFEDFTPRIYLSLDFPITLSGSLRPNIFPFEYNINKILELVESLILVVTVYRSNIEFIPDLLSWANGNSIRVKLQPVNTNKMKDQKHFEDLSNVSDRTWDEVINRIEVLDKSISQIFASWKRIYFDKVILPLPRTCINRDQFIIISPRGKRLVCFASFVKDTGMNFPHCFSHDCLFCWDHELLSKSMLSNEGI